MERMIDYDYKPQERRDLEELYKKQNVRVNGLEQENKKLKEENEYLHKLLPEADGYIIEKQLGKRLWNDGEEDTYEY